GGGAAAAAAGGLARGGGGPGRRPPPPPPPVAECGRRSGGSRAKSRRCAWLLKSRGPGGLGRGAEGRCPPADQPAQLFEAGRDGVLLPVQLVDLALGGDPVPFELGLGFGPRLGGRRLAVAGLGPG